MTSGEVDDRHATGGDAFEELARASDRALRDAHEDIGDLRGAEGFVDAGQEQRTVVVLGAGLDVLLGGLASSEVRQSIHAFMLRPPNGGNPRTAEDTSWKVSQS